MLKAAESFFEWAVKRAADMIVQAACDQHDRELRNQRTEDGMDGLRPETAGTGPTRH